ncbi:inositol monophosphatase family protein [Gilvimarinus sp. F26214L]|uniref:inositol monophosphatase family protein n=1 Tax=Gilvimarinus sp. DZF01 TaxID=3461371 RepID=UPI0040456D16
MEPMLNVALNAARKAARLAEQAAERLDKVVVETKSHNDFVTQADRAVEKEIIFHLRKAYPDHSFQGEESGLHEGSSEYEWLIDPIDGTTNFIHGMPHFAISIACLHKGRIEHAVIVDPIKREEFTASRGKGAQLNGRRIRVSPRHSLEGALIGTGIPFSGYPLQHMEGYLSCLREVAEQTAGIRRPGSAALDLAYVAAGRFDGFWEIGLQPWDIAAGILLIKEAGGLVSDLKGGESYLETGNITAGNPKVFKSLVQITQKHLGYIGR